jgi:hypothetical protein
MAQRTVAVLLRALDVGASLPRYFSRYATLGRGMRVCWVWAIAMLAVGAGAVVLSLYTTSGFFVFTVAGVGILLLTTPLMLPLVAAMIRFRRVVHTVSPTKLLRLIALDRATIVGEGWSFWLNYARPGKHVVSMTRSYAGVLSWEDDQVVVRTGTRIGDLARAASKRGKALQDRSQFDDMTVGGALKTLAHGFSTRAWMCDTVVNVEAMRLGTYHRVRMHRSDPRFRSALLDPAVILLSATLRLVEDRASVLFHRERRCVDELDLGRYMASNHRMLFVAATRVTAEWVEDAASSEEALSCAAPLLDGRPHIRVQTAWQTLGWRQDFTARVSLSEAHAYVRSLDFVEMAFIHILGYINFELFVPCECPLEEYVDYLQAYHREFSGRTEIRERVRATTHILAIDVALHCRDKERAIARLLDDLHDRFHVRRAGMHRGKYRLSSLDPIRLCSWYT